MLRHRSLRPVPGLVALLGAAALLAQSPGARPPARATEADLGGPERYLVHVATDKPIYRAGETVYARGVVLHAFTRRPLSAQTYAQAMVQIIGPKGDVVAGGGTNAQDGAAAFSWKVPDGQSGGGYKVKVGFPFQGYPDGERAFEVRAFRAPRLKSQIVFLRDGFGPGDDVQATLSVERAEGGAPAGAKVSLVAIVDGREVARQPAGVLDAAGRLAVSFRLPKAIERGEGTLALVVEDGGVVETASKTIPILVNSVDLVMFPEGGALVAGIPTRIYVEARTPSRKPADVAAVIETTAGRAIASLRTEHEGRGRTALTPKAGERYRLRIIEPAGITKVLDLPAVEPKGGVLVAAGDVTAAGAPLRFRAAATAAGSYTVTASKHEREVGSRKVALAAGTAANVEIPLPAEADGVLRVTLWDPAGFPIAERLVFRSPSRSVAVSIDADRPRYVPGGQVELKVRTTGGDGKPVSALVGISVSDDTVHELLETRDQAPQLPVQVLLEDDVWELADAHVYLDPGNPVAPRAVDLLLGTQGWRRFVHVADVKAFVAKNGDRAKRALAFVAPAPPPPPAARMAFAEGGMAVPAAPPAPMPAPQDKAGADDFAPPPEPEASEHAAKEEQRAEPPAADAPAKEQVAAQPMPKPAPAIGFAAEKKKIAMDEEDMRDLGYLGGGVAVVREYAHAVRPDRKAGERRDFAETLYWNAGIRTDASGEARVRFGLSDAVTKFRVLADAVSDEGALGAARSAVESVEPFYLEPKLPLEVTYGDVVRLPVSLVNGTLEPLQGVTLTGTAAAPLTLGSVPPLNLAEGERARRILEMTVGQKAGEASVTLAGAAGAYRDEVTRTMRVAPLGFPAAQSFGGMLSAASAATHTITIPKDVVAGSVIADVKVFPSSLGKLTSALERLIQEPNGCFEQTSSTTYPLVMATQYFTTHTGVDPAIVTRSQELLAKGYERLTGFETKSKGYEWFGESPGHEALTAFGVLEFSDMAKVRSVDAAMLARTREWLLGQRDGKGGFKRERRALHTWIEDVDCSNGYILWSLLRVGEKGLEPEIDAFLKAARASKNAYVAALGANVAQMAGRTADAAALLDRLAKAQAAGGQVDGATTSIVGSSGEALEIETTALATVAWLQSPAHQGSVEKGIRFLADSCQGGRYGSTQSTVLALQAIVAYDAERSKPRAAGSVTLLVDGQPVGAAVPFDEKTQDAITLPDAAARLASGSHTVELRMERGSEMPYALEVKLNSLTPATSPECKVALELVTPEEKMLEGDIAEVTVLVTSKASEPLPMAVAIVGLPGGLEPRHEQLKELVKGKAVAAYEVIGRDVVLYWRGLSPGQVLRVPISMVAAVPGRYTGPASRAYLYYGDEHRTFVPGFTVDVAPRK